VPLKYEQVEKYANANVVNLAGFLVFSKPNVCDIPSKQFLPLPLKTFFQSVEKFFIKERMYCL
jgi:hypothetical protein